MGRIIVAVGLVGIALITAIAYRLASLRPMPCDDPLMPSPACIARYEAHRDAVLITGLSVALLFILGSLIVFAVMRARQRQRNIAVQRGNSR
jgi:hypothetical protein